MNKEQIEQDWATLMDIINPAQIWSDKKQEAYQALGRLKSAALSQQQGEWISVEDQLPEPNPEYPIVSNPVWVTDGKKMVTSTVYSFGSKSFAAFNPNITHWMPKQERPAPPTTNTHS